jgi:protein-disulfide isomerase
MDKRIILLAIFAVMIVSVALYASSYYSQLMVMQENRMNMSGQNTPINLTSGSPVLGSTSAPITIVEFGDYQCEACYHWYHNTRADIIDNYIETGKANLVFMDLPFLGRDSITAAQATYCADDQGKYWEYHETLYNFQEAIDNGWASKDRLVSFAFNLDMNLDEFNDCMDSSKYAKRVKANYDESQRFGAEATPTFLIISPDGAVKKITSAQPYSVFSQVIEPML